MRAFTSLVRVSAASSTSAADALRLRIRSARPRASKREYSWIGSMRTSVSAALGRGEKSRVGSLSAMTEELDDRVARERRRQEEQPEGGGGRHSWRERDLVQWSWRRWT